MKTAGGRPCRFLLEGEAIAEGSKEMLSKFSAGDRITVSPNYHWAKNATGRIGSPPEQVVALSGPWDDNLTRTVRTKRGEVIFYWVWFDEAQRDAEGDGPYNGGEIPESDILLVPRTSG